MNAIYRLGTALLAGAMCTLPVIGQEGPVAGHVEPGAFAGQTLTFVSYGGIYQDGQLAALQGFVDQSGITLLSDAPTEIAKLRAQVESGNVMWDVVDTGDLAPYVHCGVLFQKLDFSRIDISNIPEGQVGECSVPAMNYGTVLMYRKSTYGDNPPTGWNDFFDVENFPGTRAIGGTGEPSTSMMELALLADGVAHEDLFPVDMDRALDKLRSMRDHLIFWQTGAQHQQMLESGEADMIVAWTGRAMTAVNNGADYAPVWNGWLVQKDQMTIPVGVTNLDAAYALLNYYVGKEAQEILSEQTSYSPIHLEARPDLDEVTTQWLTNTPERIAQGYQINIQYWVDNYEEASNKWAEFLVGN